MRWLRNIFHLQNAESSSQKLLVQRSYAILRIRLSEDNSSDGEVKGHPRQQF